MEFNIKLWTGFLVLFLTKHGLFIASESHDMATLLAKYPYNNYLLANVPRPYEIITPKRVRHNKLVGISTREHQIRHHGTYEHYKHITYQLLIDGSLQKIRLERNEALLSSGIQVRHYQDENQQIVTQAVEHCFYQGYVKRDEWSSVAVSTCHGIRGVMNFRNQTYVIQPLKGGDEGTGHPHIIFKATPSGKESCGNTLGQWLSFQELHKGEFVKRVKQLKAKQTNEQGQEETEKLLKLALVMDFSLHNQMNFTFSEMVTFGIQIANMVDLYYKDINIRTPLVYLENWSQGDKVSMSSKLRENLENFLIYKQNELGDINHHAAHLITGAEIEDNSIGISIPDSICTDRAVGINRMLNIFQPQQLATVLSHMIGHNLGIKHDEEANERFLYHEGGCRCADEVGCIMSTDVMSKSSLHSRQFSTCSNSDLEVALNMDIASCLTDTPVETFTQTCGNMHIERGEECDCGSEEDCEDIDPCCNPKTCLLKSWAQCRTGACCHNCTFLSRNHICREKSTECDVPEMCTGEGGKCPTNNYVQDGHPCDSGGGYCMGGQCPTLSQQCQHIWGPDARGGEFQCFQRFNPTGNFNGHCGKDNKTGSFAKCLPENIQCGLLHCQGGRKLPLFGSDKSFSKTTMFSNGSEFDCKVIHGPAVIDLPHFGLVQDGTKCGVGGFCMNSKCVSVSILPPLTCPGTKGTTICSGHGVCTKAKTCFCHFGWSGQDCSLKVNITTTTKSTTTSTTTKATTTTTESEIQLYPLEEIRFTTKAAESAVSVMSTEEGGISSLWLIIILASVVGGVIFVLSFTFLCYRRKSPVKLNGKKKGLFGFKKKPEKGDNCVEAGNKLISFGNLPSYKSDKMFWGKKRKKGRHTSEEESDIGELPPPPVIITDPNSARPEKSILKNCGKGDDRRSSESNTQTGSDMTCDRESMDRYMYDDDEDDDEAEEIQEILSRKFNPEHSMEALDQIAESSSFDFVLPTPNISSGCSNHSTSPPRKLTMGGYDFPMNMNPPQRPTLWKSNPNSPPKSKVIRMKNLDELIQQIDRHTIDLSPSPDELPMQISPSTSEDVRSSSTEDRHQNNCCHTPQSPQSITSGSTRDTYRPFMNSQWTKYILKRNEWDSGGMDYCDGGSPLPHINIPPPMSPLNIRNIFNYAQKSLDRETNDTPLGSQAGDCSSNNGTTNSRCGYEKSSGYGSEHDPEQYSLDNLSHTHSRSGSTSPPSYSAVIRTGTNQIKLVPAKKLQEAGIENQDLHRILQNLPRIDAGTFERSPVPTNRPKLGIMQKADSLPPGIPPPACSSNFSDPCPLSQQDSHHCGSAPCIDCSLESIPQALLAISKKCNNRSHPPFNIQRPVNSRDRKQMTRDSQSSDDSKRFSETDCMMTYLNNDDSSVTF